MGPNVVNENKFFIEEFGINFHTKLTRGRSKKGDRVHHRVSGQRGPNIMVCIAVSNRQRLVHYQVFAGGKTPEMVSRFLEVLCGNENPVLYNSKTTEKLSVSEHGQKCENLLETNYRKIIGIPKR